MGRYFGRFRRPALAPMAFLVSACGESAHLTFNDATLEAGIDFRYTFGDTTYENILESSGSGITVFDHDGDGDMDLYMLNGTFLEGISDAYGRLNSNMANSLYRNNGDGTFTEVAETCGVDDGHWSMAAGAIDYDADGDIDLYLLNYGPNIFYENDGTGLFRDATDELGLRGPSRLNGFTKWSVGVSFWDQNRDGLLDLMLGNFLAFDPEYLSPTAPDMMPHPNEYDGQPSIFYRRRPDGRFVDATEALGFHYPRSKCMGLTLFDYDDDGDLDLFQGNDHQPNFLFRNEGNDHFSEVAESAGVAANDRGEPTGSMHGTVGDIDGDGLIDLLVTDLRYGALYRSLGDGTFEDITASSGVADLFRGKGQWGAALFDYDNDGDLDLFATNGTAEELVLQPPLLLENDGLGHFENSGPAVSDYFRSKRSGRSAAVWDYDDDGDLDIIVSHVDLQATATLLRNDGGNRRHWIGFSLVGTSGPGSAIGAKVTVQSESRTQVAVNQWATSYLSSNDPRMHFGLGDDAEIVSVEVRWTGGESERFDELKADRYATLVQGKGRSMVAASGNGQVGPGVRPSPHSQ